MVFGTVGLVVVVGGIVTRVVGGEIVVGVDDVVVEGALVVGGAVGEGAGYLTTPSDAAVPIVDVGGFLGAAAGVAEHAAKATAEPTTKIN